MTRNPRQANLRALVVLPDPGSSPSMAQCTLATGRLLAETGVEVSILPVGDSQAITGPFDVVFDAQPGDAAAVALRVEEENASTQYHIIVAAGTTLLSALCARPDYAARVWALAVDFPTALDLLSAGPSPALTNIVAAARWIICPNEMIRGLLDACLPGAAQKTVVARIGIDDDVGDITRSGQIDELVERSFPSAPRLAVQGRPMRVVVAGHALHFLSAVMDHFRALPEVELRVDHVVSFARHDEAASRELVDWADVVICEWCSPVAIWYSRNKRHGQRLVVRLHRMEIYNTWPDQVDIDAVDQIVCVSPHYARLTRDRTGWPATKIVVVPNYVDVARFRRGKLPGAEFNLGFVGIVPRRKRVDLALEVLERLRRRDPRFTLFVKSQMAWDLHWAWRQPEERAYSQMLFRRIGTSSLLRDGVAFDRYGPDVAGWLRKIGFVLSTSEDESFHLAPAEGMSSGAVPALLDWPGSDTIYDTSWIHRGPEALADAIHDIVDGGRWEDVRSKAAAQALLSFDIGMVCARFIELLTNDLPPATATRSIAVVPGVQGSGAE
jgi:glycosyltransferase involved in cell wall biosynthesis